ncbi:hypothetical protein ACIP4S_30890 [Streptomyces chartreusis]|uniref:hypothetical protein n=1 Tax=Streptomyces chartreusis TaxID=1969 RepID=UPI00381568E6
MLFGAASLAATWCTNPGEVIAVRVAMVAFSERLAALFATAGFTKPSAPIDTLLSYVIGMSTTGTIPEDKAGVGAALNDTVQQADTALGIAILGSLLSSGFADRMPEGVPEEARHSIAGAVAGGDAGLIAAAREAFTASMSTTFTVSAIGVLAAALLATLVMRDDRRGPREAAGTPDEQPELVV